MKPEDKSKVQELVNDAGNLRSRNPEESKFKDWKEKTERKLEDVFGKGSEQVSRFKAVRFFDFSRRPPGSKTAPLGEDERAHYLRGIEEARRLLQRFMEN
jgi:hypothetical protein